MFKEEMLNKRILEKGSISGKKASTKKTSFPELVRNLLKFKDRLEIEKKCARQNPGKGDSQQRAMRIDYPDEDPEFEPVPWKRAILDDDDED